MQTYFFPRPVATGSIVVITIGAVFIVVSLPLLLTSGLMLVNILLFVLGILLIAVGIRSIVVTKRSNPTDEDYDRWLERQARAMLPRALQALNLDKSQITSKILRIHSIVLPGTSLAANYRDDVHLKMGKDGLWRSSINIYSYFLPSERFIAIFTRDINAMRPKGPFDDRSEEFFYRDIVSITFSVFRDKANIGGEEFVYRVQQLSLKIVNGDDIRFGGYLSAVPIDAKSGAPTILLPDGRVNKTLADLRGLLRAKKHLSR